MANGATDLTNMFNQSPYNTATDPLAQGITSGTQDAISRLQNLNNALSTGAIDFNTYQSLFSQFDPSTLQELNNITTQGSSQANAVKNAGLGQFQNLSEEGGVGANTFASMFQNLTGAAPTSQDFQNYFSNVGQILSGQPGGPAGTNYTDLNTILGNYIQNQYGPQIQQNQQTQASNALNNSLNQAGGVVNNQIQNAVNQLTNPQTMQQIQQSLNNSGQLNSGAFTNTIANTLANSAQGDISNVLGGVAIPSLQNQVATAGQPYQNYLQNLNPNLQTYGNEQTNYNLFNLQQQIAEMLAGQSQPSELQSGIYSGSQIASGIGNLLKGASGFAKA